MPSAYTSSRTFVTSGAISSPHAAQECCPSPRLTRIVSRPCRSPTGGAGRCIRSNPARLFSLTFCRISSSFISSSCRSTVRVTRFSRAVAQSGSSPGCHKLSRERLVRFAHGHAFRLASRPPDRCRRTGHALYELQFETHEMPEAHCGATRQLESIAQEERTLVSKDLSGQKQGERAVRSRCCRQDFQPAPLVRDAGDLPPIAEDDRPVVVGPEDRHDLADAGGMRRY